jgi:hypothetical protein
MMCRCEPFFPERTPGRCGEAVFWCARGLLTCTPRHLRPGQVCSRCMCRRKNAASQRHPIWLGLEVAL